MPQFLSGFSLVGATATGKTDLALHLAEWLLTDCSNYAHVDGVVLLSADSRQIYRGLEIISGADVPAEFQRTTHASTQLDPSVQQATSHYLQKKLPNQKLIEIWGVSVLTPNLSWSVAQFQQLAQVVFARARTKNYAVIVVGGTGLYQSLAFKSDWQIAVPPDEKLRRKAEQMTVKELQGWLAEVAPARLDDLNRSDLHNPRRLVRQLELAHVTPPTTINSTLLLAPTLGLTRSQADLPMVIERRVLKRLKLGAQNEFTALNLTSAQPMVKSALGVKELQLWATDQISDAELIELWTRHELQYAKRQLTWWKKQPNVTWLNVQEPNYIEQAKAWILKTNPTLPNRD